MAAANVEGAGVSTGLRGVELELVGDDRLGIVSNLTRILAEAGISIENIHTEIVPAKGSAAPPFKATRLS